MEIMNTVVFLWITALLSEIWSVDSMSLSEKPPVAFSPLAHNNAGQHFHPDSNVCPGVPSIPSSWTASRCPQSGEEYNKEGLTPLQEAVNAKNFTLVVFLVEVCKVSVSAFSLSDRNPETALHKAAAGGSPGIICYLIVNTKGLRAPANVLQNSEAGFSPGFAPLHSAVFAEFPEPALEMLLKHGAHMNLVSDSGMTALDLAWGSNIMTAYNYLKSMNATHAPCPEELPDHTFKHYGGNALFPAAIFGYDKRLQKLVTECKANLSDAKNARHYGTLHYAAFNSQPKTVKLLTEQYKMDPNGEEFPSAARTPLQYAALSNTTDHARYRDTIRYLLKAGAKVNAMTSHGPWNMTAMCLARESTKPLFVRHGGLNFSCNHQLRLQRTWENAMDLHPVLEKLKVCYPKSGANLTLAIGMDSLMDDKDKQDDVTTLFSQYGVPVDKAPFVAPLTKSERNITNDDSDADLMSLHDAINNGLGPEALVKLIKAGADVNETDKNGWTPLHTAASKGDFQAAAVLISRLADLNAETADGHDTPLNLAHLKGHKSLAALLKDVGGHLGPKCRHSYWAGLLALAVESNQPSGTKVALACGADHDQAMVSPSAAAGKGTVFPIHVASSHCDATNVHLLLDHGVNPNVRTSKDGFTPAHFAIMAMANTSCDPLPILEELRRKGGILHLAGKSEEGVSAIPLEMVIKTERKDEIAKKVSRFLSSLKE